MHTYKYTSMFALHSFRHIHTINIYTYKYLYACHNIHKQIHANIHKYIHKNSWTTYMYISMHINHMYVYIHVHIHAYIHTCITYYIHTYMHYVHTYIQTYILHIYIHTFIYKFKYIHWYIYYIYINSCKFTCIHLILTLYQLLSYLHNWKSDIDGIYKNVDEAQESTQDALNNLRLWSLDSSILQLINLWRLVSYCDIYNRRAESYQKGGFCVISWLHDNLYIIDRFVLFICDVIFINYHISNNIFLILVSILKRLWLKNMNLIFALKKYLTDL